VLRIRDAGLSRDEVLSQLSMVFSESVIDALSQSAPADHARLVEAFDALPLPSVEDIATALVAVARSTPGIAADEHVERTMTALGSVMFGDTGHGQRALPGLHQ